MTVSLFFLTFLGFEVINNVFAFRPRISNAKDTKEGEFKSFAKILWGVPHVKFLLVGGGTIVNDYWILCAASAIQMVPDIGQLKIRIGKHSSSTNKKRIQTMKVAQRISHDRWKGQLSAYDITLLKTKSAIIMNEFVQPARVPHRGRYHIGMAYMIGFGKTSTSFFSQSPSVLQAATAYIIENELCKRYMTAYKVNRTLINSQLCTHTPEKNVVAFSGDAGGPLLRLLKRQEEIIGIMSWSLIDERKTGIATVHTRVSHFIDWIEEKISPSIILTVY